MDVASHLLTSSLSLLFCPALLCSTVHYRYMEINLHAVIRAGILEEIHKRYIIYQCLAALKLMHSGSLLHRDMKPSNVLLNSDCHVKLCDLGLARSVAADAEDGNQAGNTPALPSAVLTDYVATRWYRAPEILLGSHAYTKGVDMWSMGCIMAELLSGQPLFPGESTMNQLERIIEVTGKPSKVDMQAIKSKHTETMIANLTLRPQRTLASLFPAAPADAIDLMSQLLQFNPERRISVHGAISHPYLAQFHDPSSEPELSVAISISIDDNKRFSIAEYRKYLYKKIIEKKKEIRAKKENTMAVAANTVTHQPYNASQSQPHQHSSASTGSGSSLHQSQPQHPYAARQSLASAAQPRRSMGSSSAGGAHRSMQHSTSQQTMPSNHTSHSHAHHSYQSPYAQQVNGRVSSAAHSRQSSSHVAPPVPSSTTSKSSSLQHSYSHQVIGSHAAPHVATSNSRLATRTASRKAARSSMGAGVRVNSNAAN